MSIVLQGSTSGSVTLQEPAIAGTTVLDLPAVSGTILTTGSSGQSIPKAALPTGSVLQVVNATYSTSTTNSTTNYADTGLTATITPLFASSKILIFVNQVGCGKDSASDSYLLLRLLKSSTQLIEFEKFGGYEESAKKLFFGSCSTTYLDSPSTTSATTYKTQFARAGAAGTVAVQLNGGVSTITLMEIAA